MKRDLLLGAVLAVFLHLSVALYSHLTTDPVPARGPSAKLEPVPFAEPLPEILPDLDPDVATELEPVAKAVPVSLDLPQPVGLKDFVIPPDPVRPIDPALTATAYTIPTTHVAGTGRRAFYRESEVDQAPQAVLQVGPAYPATMRTQKVTGEVVVRFVVDANNAVRDVRVVSSTDRAFEAAAVQAVEKWKFRAGRKGGRPVPVQMEVPMRFQLK